MLDAALLPDVGDDLGHGGEGPRGRAEPGRGGGGEQVRGAAVLVVLAAQAQDRAPPAACTVSHASMLEPYLDCILQLQSYLQDQ